MAFIAPNVPHSVQACHHVAVLRLAEVDVDDAVEQECFSVLAIELPRDKSFDGCQMRRAFHAAKDSARGQELSVSHSHDERLMRNGGKPRLVSSDLRWASWFYVLPHDVSGEPSKIE